MFKNYLSIVFRNLIHHKTFSLINILGLAFGISTCLVIYFYVSYEKRYDTFNENIDHIYRLKNVRYYASGTDSSAGCTARLGPALKEEFPEVIAFTRLRKEGALVTFKNIAFTERNIFWADSSFLTMFSFPLISGDAEKALTDRYSAVLTQNTAQKYFGNNDAMGETIRLDGLDFKITGIAKNVPSNSHIKFDILISFHTQLNDGFCWDCNNNNTYIQVTPGTEKKVIENKLPVIVDKLHDAQINGFDRAYFLQPLKDIHLYSNLRFEHEKNGNAEMVGFLFLIAIVTLLIAWINYINLTTARSFERAKEVGLRKVVGAGFGTLVRQFLLESFIVNFIAILISIVLVEITYPFWNELIRIPASFFLWYNTNVIMLLLALVFISPAIAGLYPAFVLSSYSLPSILKGNFRSSLKGIFLRKSLVIFQFMISIILITTVIVFYKQISFMQNKNLGFSIEQKLVVNAPSKIQKGIKRVSAYNTFINELKNQAIIEDASCTSIIPGIQNHEVTGGVRQSEQQHDQGRQMYFTYVAQNYFNIMNIDIVCGRTFFESELRRYYNEGHERSLIINESAAREFGFESPDKAIGASIYADNDKIGNVIGVIKNYHQQSLDKEIHPTIFKGITGGNYFIININTENVSKKINEIKNEFTNTFPGNPFEYTFLDDFFNKQYSSNIKETQILGIFTFLSIFISCLGLLGLSLLITIHKTKEIGIRKIVGATILNIVTLLSKDFIKWVLFANLIAWPIAYFAMKNWLQNFAYRIDLTIWPFLLAGLSVLVIALLTVNWQAIKAATSNPVEALRYE